MLKTEEKFDITWEDASRICQFCRCECRYMFKCLMGLQKPRLDALLTPMPDRPTAGCGNIALDYGTVMHAVLPHMYNGDVEKPCQVFDALWAKYPYGESNDKRNTSLTRSRIVEFVSSHAKETRQYDIEHFEFSSPAEELISENEVPFLIDIGADHLLAGRIDNAVVLHATNSLWAYDFKTSSEISERYYKNFWNAPQVVAYTIALSQITGKTVDGLILEAMRISPKTIESQYRPIYVNAVNIKRFIEEFKFTCAKINAANETGVWRQESALCSTYSSFGMPGYTCEYADLCDAADWRNVVRFYEREKPFNPLEVTVG